MSQSLNYQLQPGPLPSRERSAMDVLLRCFAYEVGAETGMLVERVAGSKTRVLAIWGLAGSQPYAPWVPNSLIGRAFGASGAIIEPAATTSNGHAPENGHASESSATAVEVAAPVIGESGSLGAIYASFAEDPALSAERLRWITESYATLAALCVEGGEGLASTLMASSVDRLSGCLSRDAVLAALDVEVQRTQRQGGRLSVCLLDLDEFRTINDALGHLEGNRVLAAVGEELRRATRPYDAVGRMEEDEFVVIFADTGAAKARQSVERMRARVAEAIATTVGIPGSVSAGVAELEAEDSVQTLLEGAYRALRRAKPPREPVGTGPSGPSAFDGRSNGFLETAKSLVRGHRRAPVSTNEAGS